MVSEMYAYICKKESKIYFLAISLIVTAKSHAAIYKCTNEDSEKTQYNASPISGSKCTKLDLTPEGEKSATLPEKKKIQKIRIVPKKSSEEKLPYPKIE